MAAAGGEYRVKTHYVETQCDGSCDKTYSGDIHNAYFDATTTPTATFTFSPKTGYMITDIGIDSFDTRNVTYEIIGGNKVKVTASSDVVSGYGSGNISITVTTAEAINDLSTLFTKIANAIRAKTGKTGQIKAVNFHSEIESIQTGGLVPATVTIGTQQSISGISLFAGALILDDTVNVEYRYYDFEAKTYTSKILNADVHENALQLKTAIGTLIYVSSNKTPIQITGLELAGNVTLSGDTPVYIVTSENAAIVYPNP